MARGAAAILLLLVVAPVTRAFVLPRGRPTATTVVDAAKKRRKKKGGGPGKKTGGGGGGAAAPEPAAFAFPTAEAIVEPVDAPAVGLAPLGGDDDDVSDAVAKMRALEARRSADEAAMADSNRAATVMDAKDLIVDEPGKLFGKPIDKQLETRKGPRRRKEAEAAAADGGGKPGGLPEIKLPEIKLPDASETVTMLGGKRPDDPTDTFDYGLGGIVKSSVFFVSGLAIVWEIYINSPLFERAAEPPALTAVKQEMSKYQPPVDGVDDVVAGP